MNTFIKNTSILGISISVVLVYFLFTLPHPVSSAPPNFTISVNEIVATGLDHPVAITHAGDNSGRLFIVEQPGTIRIIKNGSLLSQPFLDIKSLVLYGGERGLLGLAFHPNYSQNGYFYVNYTRKNDGATVIARYQVSGNPDIANPSSAFILLIIPQPYSNHNGGNVIFGPDGYLYIGMGDGGSGGDPQNYAQNKNSLLGKMLRIDVDHGSPYAIPADNPFVNADGLDEIWDWGLRNPWRFSFDRLNGDMYIGDVGQNTWEEVDFHPASQPGGINFGWRCREGAHTYTSSPPCNDPSYLATLTDPITEYNHSEGYSITGGVVYRGFLYPALNGTYFFGDYVTGKIWSIKKLSSSPTTWSSRVLETQAGFNISAFGEGENGEIYIANHNNGSIHHLVDLAGPVDYSSAVNASKKLASTQWANPTEVVTYSISLKNQSPSLITDLVVSDTIPGGLLYIPGSLTATSGTIDDTSSPQLFWFGDLASNSEVSIQYRVEVNSNAKDSINNTADILVNGTNVHKMSATLFVPRPVLTTTVDDFSLPGTQPNQLTHPLLDSTDCDICHSAPIYDRWRGSMMSQSGRDPLMWAALAASNNFVPSSGELCLRCHLPNGWFAGHSADPSGSLMTPADIRNGISCQTCHRMVDPDPPPGSSDQATTLDNLIRQNMSDPIPSGVHGSGMMIIDPMDNRRGPFALASTFNYHTAFQTNFLGQQSDRITRSRLCATCHDIDNPILSWDSTRNQYWFNTGVPDPAPKGTPFPIERTYTEWLYSAYASETGVYAPQFAGAKADHMVGSCQDCHIPRTTGTAADDAFNPFQRDCQLTGCLPSHDLVGANTWIPQLLTDPQWRLNAQSDQSYINFTKLTTQSFLSKAASLDLSLYEENGQKYARVRVTNETGHKLPTGYPEGRRMWIHLRAFDANGILLDEFGEYNPVTDEIASDTKIYEVQQGITPELASTLGVDAGHSFHFLLNNTVIKDNRIPPRGFTNDHYNVDGLRPVGAAYADGQYWDDTVFEVPPQTEHLIVALYYQVASKEYINFLAQNGGLDGQMLSPLTQKYPPTPQLIKASWIPNYPFFLPIILR